MIDHDALHLLQQTAVDAEASRLEVARHLNALPLPDNYTLHDLEEMLPQRRRFRGVFNTTAIAAFADAVQEYPDAPVFVNPDKELVATAIFNLGTPEAPGHGDHRAVLYLRSTPEYQAIQAMNGQQFPQVTLIEFLEDWAPMMLTSYHNGDKTLAPAEAFAAIRAITVANSKSVRSNEEALRRERGVLETIEVRDAALFPTRVVFQCAPALGLPVRPIAVRLNVITAQDTPKIGARIVAVEALQQAVLEDFRTALAEVLPQPPRLGSFSTNPR